MLRVVLSAVVALAGCNDVFGLDPPGDAPGDDDAIGGIDAPDDGCYGRNGAGGTGLLRICLPIEPPPTVSLGSTIDTTLDASCPVRVPQPGGAPELCVIAAASIDVQSGVRVRGLRPLVLLATGSLVVQAGAVLDVSSSIAVGLGAGSPGPACAPIAAPLNGASDDDGGGGGAGGSLGTAGGRGGRGQPAAATGGMPVATPTPVVLGGGCPGGLGGVGSAPVSNGFGGAGGGAVYLIAGEQIGISGTINASGAGGTGGRSGGSGGGGGGGGGSGGFIGLDAPTVEITSTGVVFANGGGGGGGASTSGIMGSSGGVSMGPTSGGAGGSAGGLGGAGGGGVPAAPGPTGSTPTSSGGGGGGGGGGVGLIRVYAGQAEIDGQVSPAPST